MGAGAAREPRWIDPRPELDCAAMDDALDLSRAALDSLSQKEKTRVMLAGQKKRPALGGSCVVVD